VERDDPMMKNDVLLTERSGSVLVLTLNRPEVRNALNPELKDRLANAPLGVAVTKKLMRERRWAEPEDIEAVFRSTDAMEGARAFAERRPPVWTGK
jgi:enoyl-CoA hydratase/carnithine racemase